MYGEELKVHPGIPVGPMQQDVVPLDRQQHACHADSMVLGPVVCCRVSTTAKLTYCLFALLWHASTAVRKIHLRGAQLWVDCIGEGAECTSM